MSHHLEDSGTSNLSEHQSPGGTETQLAEANIILPVESVLAIGFNELFGCTGTGKTSFANIASGSEMRVGKGLRSSTKHLEASNTFQVDNQPVVVVDCPGFNDTYLTETEILRRLAEFLTNAYTSKCNIVGLLYFHNISDTRVGGASYLHMNLFKALCGPIALKNAIYVTNMWSNPPTEDQMMREAELRETDNFFGEALAKGAHMARHYNTLESAHEIVRKLLGKSPVVTQLQRQLVDDEMPLEDTDAGLVIGKDLEDDLRKQQEEMNDLTLAKEKALESNNQNWLRRLEAQEESAKAKERQLIDQLQLLKAKRTTKSEITGSKVHHGKEVADPNLTSARRIQEQIEVKINELTKNTNRHNRSLGPSIPTQEWNRQRDNEIARDIQRINAEATYSRGHDNRGFVSLAVDAGSAIVDAGSAVVDAGSAVFSTLTRVTNLRRDTSSSAVRDSHRSGSAPHHAQEAIMENVGPSFGSPHPAPSSGFNDTGIRQGQSASARPRRSSGHKSTHDGREARTTGSKKRSQGHDARAPDRRSPSPGYE